MEETISLDAIAATAGGGAARPAAAAAAAGGGAGGGLYSGLSNMPGDQPPLAPTLRRDQAMDFR